MRRTLVLIFLALLMAGCTGEVNSPTQPASSFEIETILPEDAIPALDHPRAVSATEAASHTGPQQMVIGVEIEGESRAYPLGLMSRYEIANDTLGGQPILVTFCPVCNSGIVASREIVPQDGAVRTVSFGFAGKLVDDALVMKDRETGSLWAQSRAVALEGPLAGTPLRLIVANQMTWQEWQSSHPDTTLVVDPSGETAPVVAGLPSVPTGGASPAIAGYILGLAGEQGATAFSVEDVESAGVVNADPDGAAPLLLVSLGKPGAVTAWIREVEGEVLSFTHDGEALRDEQSGSVWNPMTGRAESGPMEGAQLSPVELRVSHWLGWKDLHPATAVWNLEG